MLPTAGFVPPPVAPLVPAAANGIVATGGLLAGAVAGAAAGAKAGSILGPKGALAGAVVGALLLPLLAPQPTAPGTIPMLDPGLNEGPSPAPGTEYPSGTLTAGDPSPDAPVQYFYGSYVTCRTETENYRCIDGPGDDNWITPASCSSESTWGFSGRSVTIQTQSFVSSTTCDPLTYFDDFLVKVVGIQEDGTETLVKQEKRRNGTWTNGVGVVGELSKVYAKVLSFNAGGVDQPIPDQEPGPGTPTPKPRPNPIPIVPTTDPDSPAPLPEIVPQPEPEPAPEPLEVPSPDTPDAPPVTIPKAPPAPPQEVPGPETDPLPQRVPTTPTPISPPLPVPGVPTVPEPSPDPQIFPAPGPSPLPLPSPDPTPSPDPGTAPGTDPDPGTVPIPVPPGTPGPGPITTPITPENPQAVDPGTGPIQLPLPLPKPTPSGSHFPVPGGPAVTPGGTRPDLSAIAAEVGRIEQKVARLQNGKDGLDLSDWLWLLPLLQDFFQGDIPGTTYDLQGVCEPVEPGQEQPIALFPVEPAKNLGAIINRLDVMQDIFQQHLAWRTPTCQGEPPKGEWRTIHFISDETSAGGKRRIDRRFRYRSLGVGSLDALVDHWKDFTWTGGPVIVKHKGAWWGTPQVWAASGNEGKRVIRHAAGEAGIDPDKTGRWEIGGTSNPRYGMPCTLKVNRKGGYWWITVRDGPSERPLVATAPPDL